MNSLPNEMKEIINTKTDELNTEVFSIKTDTGFSLRFQRDMVKDPVDYIRVVQRNEEGEESSFVIRNMKKLELLYDMIMEYSLDDVKDVTLEYRQGCNSVDTCMFNEYPEFDADLKKKTMEWVSAMRYFKE